MTGFDADLAAIHRARVQTENTLTALAKQRASVSATMSELLDGGWSGAAALAFSGAWTEWGISADEILTALNDLGTALTQTVTAYTVTDHHHAAALSSLNMD